MKRLLWDRCHHLLTACALLLLFSPGAHPMLAQASKAPDFRAIDQILNQAVANHRLPGAVVIIGHNGNVVFEHAYGERSLEPTRAPMRENTIFDMASMTKVMATTTAAMELYQQGRFRLNDPVAKYLPAFAQNGKASITIRQVMTHYSGLPPDLDLKEPWSGKQKAYEMAMAAKPDHPPGTNFRYSDINFIVMGALVEKLSGMTLDQYAAKNVFAPLKMTHTRYLPPASWRPDIAPTQYDENHHMLLGVVHDPTARRMGGVAGHAGLFSTASDVSLFAQALLDRLAGRQSAFPVNQLTAEKMTTPQQPATATSLRGLGWDIESPFSGNRGELFPVGGFGHTGFTGTDIWVDPWSDTYVILLSNRVHPNGGVSTIAIDGKVANAAAEALNIRLPEHGKEIARLTGYNESLTNMRRYQSRNGTVLTGIDVLENDHFSQLAALKTRHGGQLRVGILTNDTAIDNTGRRTIDVLAHDAPGFVPGLSVTTLFSPEHGLSASQDTTKIGNGKDAATGLPVISLYGSTDAQRRPPVEKLRNLDAIVIDLRDVGVRFYTYETAVAYVMEAAAKTGTDVVVLDRPNPITGSFVQGPVSDPGASTYTGFMPLPARHGMTFGEIARYFNGEGHLGASLTVVPIAGWQRGDWYDSTSLLWVNPSPNLRNLDETTIYPGIGMIEGSNISVGRGTDTPFLWVGAPWVEAAQLASALNARLIPGVRFVPVQFTPVAPYPYAGQRCSGVQFVITQRNVLDAPELGLEVAAMLHKLYPGEYHMDGIARLVANQATVHALQSGEDPQTIAESWQTAIDAFQERRKPYLLYH